MKKDSNFLGLILKLDLFGKKPLLKVNRNESFRTVFGSILTIFALLLMISTMIYFSLGLLDRQHPNLILSIINTFNPPEIRLSNKTFGFAFGLQNPFTYEQFIDESIYRVEVFQKIASRQPDSSFSWKVNQIETEPCNLSKFPESYQDLVLNLPLNKFYCLKETNFTVFGTFLNPTYAFLYIQIFECRNTSNSQLCKPKSEIDRLLAGTFFSFSHTDITIDPTNFTYPNQQFMGDSYTTVSNKYFKEMHHYEKQIIITTNKGWLIDDIHENRFLKMDNIKEMIDFRQAENFLSYTFKLSTTVETYTRSYKKIQSVAAEVGGLFKVITMSCGIITFMWNKAKINEVLANELFMIVNNEDEIKRDIFKFDKTSNLHQEESDIDRSVGNISKIIKLNTQAMIKRKITNEESRLKNFSFKKKLNKNLELTCCEGLFIYLFPCCFNNKNLKILQKLEPEIDEKFELMNIFKKLNELDRLKKILFDEDQQTLLSIPHKTIIKLYDSQTISSLMLSNSEINNKKDYKRAYFNIKLKENDPINSKLLNIIEPDIRLLLS